MGYKDSTVRDAFYWDARTDAIRELELNTHISNPHCTLFIMPFRENFSDHRIRPLKLSG